MVRLVLAALVVVLIYAPADALTWGRRRNGGTTTTTTTTAPPPTSALSTSTLQTTTAAPTTAAPTTTAATTTTAKPTTTTAAPSPTTTTPSVVAGCAAGPSHPAGYYASADVSDLPALANTWVQSVAGADPTGKLNLFAGNQVAGTQPEGFPVNLIGSNYGTTSFYWGSWGGWANPGPYPAPEYLKYEGYPGAPLYDGIQSTINTSTCTTAEVIGVNNVFGLFLGGSLPGPWKAEGGAVWDANYTPTVVNYTPQGVTASAVPLAPLVLRWADVQNALNGVPIDHAFHWYGPTGAGRCRGGARTLGQGFVWPARNDDCSTTSVDPNAPPYGAWFRLRADYPEAALSPQARVVVQALKTHGMILGDGGGQGIAAESAPCPVPSTDATRCWQNAALSQLESINLTDFEAVDTASLRANPAAGVASTDFCKVK